MGGIGKRILGVFVEKVERPSTTTPQPSGSGAPPPGTSVAQQRAATVPPANDESSQKVYDVMAEEVKKRGGTIYESFNQQLTALASVIPDESTRFRAAFAATAAAIPGTTVVSIIAAVDERLRSIDEEMGEAEHELQSGEAVDVGSRQQELDTVVQSIEQLRRQLTGLEQQRSTLERGIVDVRNAIALRRGRFEQAATRLKTEYSDIRAKLARYQGGNP